MLFRKILLLFVTVFLFLGCSSETLDRTNDIREKVIPGKWESECINSLDDIYSRKEILSFNKEKQEILMMEYHFDTLDCLERPYETVEAKASYLVNYTDEEYESYHIYEMYIKILSNNFLLDMILGIPFSQEVYIEFYIDKKGYMHTGSITKIHDGTSSDRRADDFSSDLRYKK